MKTFMILTRFLLRLSATRVGQDGMQRRPFATTPFKLRMFSPNILTLTLVDLPGSILGDQPKDLEDQIRNMLFKYISKPAA